jgi:hypothetical protein
MPINHNEIIEEFTAHIRKLGGEAGEWRAGTAKDARGPFFRQHLENDLGDGLTYREAYTTSAADAVLDHLVNACGLRPDRDSVPAPGKIVFVYRPRAPSGEFTTADCPVAASPPQTRPD